MINDQVSVRPYILQNVVWIAVGVLIVVRVEAAAAAVVVVAVVSGGFRGGAQGVCPPPQFL